jgi:hypothetical protein
MISMDERSRSPLRIMIVEEDEDTLSLFGDM